MNIIEKLVGLRPVIEKELRKQENYYLSDVIVAYDDKGHFADAYVLNSLKSVVINLKTKRITEVHNIQNVNSKIISALLKEKKSYDKLNIKSLPYCIKYFGNNKMIKKYLVVDRQGNYAKINIAELLEFMDRIKKTNEKIYLKSLNKKQNEI